MTALLPPPLLGRMLRPLASRLRPEMIEALAEMRADPEDQARYEFLATKSTEGTLTSAERQELESILQANSFLTAIKTEAMLALTSAAA
jgi:hypothetical protein